MTDRATLEALLARVLEGTGPDRELDGEIWRIAEPAAFTAPHGLDCKPWRYIGNGVWRDDSDPEGHNKAFAPPYTASLDAALTVLFGNPPPLIPSEPRLVLRDALRERIEAQGE